MLTDKAKEKASVWRRLWGFTKSYVVDVGRVYLDFLTPMALILILNMAIDTRDKERFGLSWLHCTNLKSDKLREEKFPQYEPSTAAQRRRTEAANAAEYAVQSV